MLLPTLNSRIEELEDLRWHSGDQSAQLRALLDEQDDIVVRRDEAGCITFANRTFCRQFSVTLADIVGTTFVPRPSRRENAAAVSRPDDTLDCSSWPPETVERMITSKGPRWIRWTHKRVCDPCTSELAVQSVGHDITEQRRHERALAAARDEARAADLAKSRFLASMSHEIRTPMNGILGMTGLLAETRQSAEQKTYTQAVRKSAVTLLALIDEILDFSKIEAGRVELAEAPVDIVDCVQSAVELLAPRAYQKGLQLAGRWRRICRTSFSATKHACARS